MKRLLFIPLAMMIAVIGLISGPHQVSAHPGHDHNEVRQSGAARCAVGKGRLGTILDTMRANSERRVATYTAASERVTARMEVLKQKGYDTSRLNASLQMVATQLIDYRMKNENLSIALVIARDAACEDSDDSFSRALADARTQLRAVREASQSIHQTFQDNVVPEIKTAAAWLKSN